jgi:hypothetical protein
MLIILADEDGDDGGVDSGLIISKEQQEFVLLSCVFTSNLFNGMDIDCIFDDGASKTP